MQTWTSSVIVTDVVRYRTEHLSGDAFVSHVVHCFMVCNLPVTLPCAAFNLQNFWDFSDDLGALSIVPFPKLAPWQWWFLHTPEMDVLWARLQYPSAYDWYGHPNSGWRVGHWPGDLDRPQLFGYRLIIPATRWAFKYQIWYHTIQVSQTIDVPRGEMRSQLPFAKDSIERSWVPWCTNFCYGRVGRLKPFPAVETPGISLCWRSREVIHGGTTALGGCDFHQWRVRSDRPPRSLRIVTARTRRWEFSPGRKRWKLVLKGRFFCARHFT